MLLDLLFPPRCYGCGSLGSYFCSACLKKLTINSISPFPPPPLAGRLSLFKYDGCIRNCLVDLKYKFVSHLSLNLSDLICHQLITRFPNLLSFWQDHQFCLVPIPLHPFRQNWRGFNQSYLLGQIIASTLGLHFCPRALTRHKFTSPQTKLPPRQRVKNPKNTFQLIDPSPPPNIILFDDVYTTGSTIRSAARTLSKTDQIWALTVAG